MQQKLAILLDKYVLFLENTKYRLSSIKERLGVDMFIFLSPPLRVCV